MGDWYGDVSVRLAQREARLVGLQSRGAARSLRAGLAVDDPRGYCSFGDWVADVVDAQRESAVLSMAARVRYAGEFGLGGL